MTYLKVIITLAAVTSSLKLSLLYINRSYLANQEKPENYFWEPYSLQSMEQYYIAGSRINYFILESGLILISQ